VSQGFHIRVEVFLKNGVLDVQGKAVEGALSGLGFGDVSDVRVGKIITFELTSQSKETAHSEAKLMAEQLLANLVIESYPVHIS
jgi:phosphoribosylformylglycinamidine synthase subunit PurS